jgi:hypothetical protein
MTRSTRPCNFGKINKPPVFVELHPDVAVTVFLGKVIDSLVKQGEIFTCSGGVTVMDSE